MSRWPLRLRLVAGFSVVMFLVITAADVYVYARVRDALDESLNHDLVVVSGILANEVAGAGEVLDPDLAATRGGTFQVLDADGVVLQRSSGAPDTALVGRRELRSRQHLVELASLKSDPPDARRALVTPVASPSGRVWLVVSLRLVRRDEALRELAAGMVVATLIALVLTGLVGDRLARSALTPVERYRRRAARIAGGASGLRLEVPTERDDEVTRLGHTLNDMLEALERALASERRFVDDASHELRTPLAVLVSRLQLAQRRPRSVSEHEEFLAEMTEDVQRLRVLAEQLLDLSRPSTGRTDDAQRVIGEIATDVVAGVSLEIPGAAVAVAMDEASLRRVVTNLVTNARLHGAEPIDVSLTVLADRARLVVTDAGPGISEAFLPLAQDRFARADDARPRPGSGLGLAIVTDLVEYVGGSVTLANKVPPASGLIVTVDLPLASRSPE